MISPNACNVLRSLARIFLIDRSKEVSLLMAYRWVVVPSRLQQSKPVPERCLLSPAILRDFLVGRSQ